MAEGTSSKAFMLPHQEITDIDAAEKLKRLFGFELWCYPVCKFIGDTIES